MRDIATKLFHFTRLCVGIMVITVSCMMNAQNANAQGKRLFLLSAVLLSLIIKLM